MKSVSLLRYRGQALLLLLLLLAIPPAAPLDNGLGLVPPLAYSTWNYFNDAVNDTLVRALADSLVSTGLAAAGFRTLNIDAGYLIHERHPVTRRLQVNATKFPHGMRAVADYLDAKGLGLGVYTDHGNGSCGSGPGSYGYYDLDAQTFADWHVSYLKVDFCGTHPSPGVPSFADWMDPVQQLRRWQELRDALNRTGRPIYYSICPHGKPPPTGPSTPWVHNGSGLCYSPPRSWTAEERKATANSILVEYTNLFDFWYAENWQDFRVCGPTPTCPDCPYVPGTTHGSCSRFPNGTHNPAVPPSPGGLLTDIDAMVALTSPEDSGPGSWADADMLQVCNYGKGGTNAGGRDDGGMTLEEYRASYSIWAVLASPIIISPDLRTLAEDHPDCLAMLKNPEILAIAQDRLAKAGGLVRQRTNSSDSSPDAARCTNIVEQVFSRELEGGAMAVALFNRAEMPLNISVTWKELGLSGDTYSVRDIWRRNEVGEDVGEYRGGYSAVVPPHAALTLRLSPAAGLEQAPKICNVLTFGAKGDNATEDTKAIQSAIDACAGAGLGSVLLPSGHVYLTMPVTLPSHTTLVVEAGAVLLASPDIHRWPNSTHGVTCHTTPYESKHPVFVPQLENFVSAATNSTDVTISGGGSIDGQGWRWWPLRKQPGDYWHNCRPRLVAGEYLTRFTMHNITLRNSPMYVVSAHYLSTASFTRVTIDSNPGYGYSGAPNTDGFNVHGRDIYIGQSSVRNGDDCVPIGPNSSNITVEDLHCSRGNGVVPIIWSHPGVIEDVIFRRVTMESTTTAIAVKSLPSYVGTVRNVLWEDIVVNDVRGSAVMLNMFNQNMDGDSADGLEAAERAGAGAPSLMQLHNLTIRNVVVTGARQAGKIECGNGTHACDGLTMSNVTMRDFGQGWECVGEVGGSAEGCEPRPCF